MTRSALVGSRDHSDWMVLVTIASDGTLLDRRRIVLGEAGLPVFPHHHEGQALPIDEAVALVERVRAVAHRRAAEGLAELARALGFEPGSISIRECPQLPESVADRIRNYRSQCVADSVLYRDALAAAAQGRGWAVDWYDPRRLDLDAVADLLREAGTKAGPPWQKDHRVAMAASLTARLRPGRA